MPIKRNSDKYKEYAASHYEMDLEELLDEYYDCRLRWESMVNRDDHVHWSEEAEAESLELMQAVKNEISVRVNDCG